jgi:hypothetical protein
MSIAYNGFKYGIIFTDTFRRPKEIIDSIMEITIRELYLERFGTSFVTSAKYYNLTLCTEEDLQGSTEELSGQLNADAVYCSDSYNFQVYGSYGSKE